MISRVPCEYTHKYWFFVKSFQLQIYLSILSFFPNSVTVEFSIDCLIREPCKPCRQEPCSPDQSFILKPFKSKTFSRLVIKLTRLEISLTRRTRELIRSKNFCSRLIVCFSRESYFTTRELAVSSAVQASFVRNFFL